MQLLQKGKPFHDFECDRGILANRQGVEKLWQVVFMKSWYT
jgi:hypothetical protein